jgi:predicted RNA binding protein YcfA (HicA-like mRNA interferase family)
VPTDWSAFLFLVKSVRITGFWDQIEKLVEHIGFFQVTLDPFSGFGTAPARGSHDAYKRALVTQI